MTPTKELNNFSKLGLPRNILTALSELGYEKPTPVQEQSIPILLKGKNLLAQAQTGTGKTAAFALPILANLSHENKHPQALVLTPTRELALQVAEAFNSYAKHINNFHVLPIYGGQDMGRQLKALKRGVHVVVGTPGRIIDHLRRGTLCMDKIKTIILDEADEMLKMGFIDDVTWILKQAPSSEHYQTALFSATMPTSIQQIANNYLHQAKEVKINPKAKTVAAIQQQYMLLADTHKLDALTNLLEIEEFDAILIFTRTKISSATVADKLTARGFAAAALNGDMNQRARERVITLIKNKSLDIIVATDVAARGIDIDRISHVISYDIPCDPGSYIHRIGRTGRAGRTGKAMLFVTPRERYLLRDIERLLNQPITAINPPSLAEIKRKRVATFTKRILQALENDNLDYYRELIETIVHSHECSELDIAAATLACFAKKEKSLQGLESIKEIKPERFPETHEKTFKSKKKGSKTRRFNKDKIKKKSKRTK